MGLGFASALRLDPGRRAAMALGLVAVVVALLTLAWLLVDRPRSMSVSRTAKDVARASATTTIPSTAMTPFSKATPSNGASVTTGSSPSSRSASAVAPGVVVDVVGHVSRPGVYELPAGARVTDALTAAGGALPGVDLTGLNLASKLTDGQQVAVGIGGLPPAVASVSPASGSPAAPVNLNTASVADLDGLPGVGPVLAQHIIDWRTQHGHFDSVDQLREVTGIGPAKFTDLKALVTV
ncbi:MAG: ComEA family DNA-binding protein [Actinobacteria bacterium]|nr:ComEA family DNA-binding protein [Actinomycetota bacterium]